VAFKIALRAGRSRIERVTAGMSSRARRGIG
jgi:hypothetical protein